MDAYIALDERLALQVDMANVLTAKMLGPQCRYIPLKETPQGAIDSVVQATAINGRVAVESITWIVLQITIEKEQLIDLFQSQTISRNIAKGGWQWYGELDYRNYGHCFHKSDMEPIGLDAWANKVLAPRYNVKIASVCHECREFRQATWTAKKDFNFRDYCAKCWHAFYYEAFTH